MASSLIAAEKASQTGQGSAERGPNEDAMKNQHSKPPRGEKSPDGLGQPFLFIRLRKDRNWGKGDKTLRK